MGRIQSSVGLVSGLNITNTVDQLISIAAQPRDLLAARNKQYQSQQVALTEVTSLVVGMQLASRRLGDSSQFSQKAVTSSNESALSATVTGTPQSGTFRFTPVQMAQKHQVMSDGFTSLDESLSAGEFSVKFGGFVDRSLSLDQLNGGQGVDRGKIRVTDRSGASAVIDLRTATTADDVVKAINASDEIDVTASVVGDHLRLVDNTNQTASNLKVQDVGLTSTAADLGLKASVAANTFDGSDVVQLYDNLELQQLNDGNGVNIRKGMPHLEVSFRDGSSPLQIEFNAQTKGATQSTLLTDAANGTDAKVKLTSVGTGSSADGYVLSFVNDDKIVAGEETVKINSNSKTITVRIDEGKTQAYQVAAAINADETAKQFFTASVADGGNGSGLINAADTGTSAGGAIEYKNETTVGDLLSTINAADPTRLQARISADGGRIELQDLTSGSGEFSAKSLYGGSVAEDLGLTNAAEDGVISGRRRFAGLGTVLLDSLSGGQGVGTLGTLELKDRSGATATVDLSSAETLSDVIEAINAAPVSLEASINSSRNGLTISDTSGGTGKLQITSGDSNNTADRLGIAIDAASSRVETGSLDLQMFSEQTALSDLNQGQGVKLGSFLITDSKGQTAAVNLSSNKATTVGDVIDLITALNIGVEAGINDTGDGIVIRDTAGGTGTMAIEDSGSGTAAADLKIAGTAVSADHNGTPTQTLDGSTALRITLGEGDTLQDLADQINQANAGVTASVFNSGMGRTPYRLSLVSQISGKEGEMLVDGTAWGAQFEDVNAAQDAVVLVGSGSSSTSSTLAVSSNNQFDQLVDGVSLTVVAPSTSEVIVDVSTSNTSITTQVDLFVQQYNKIRDKVDTLTAYNATDNTAGALYASAEMLRVDSDLTRLVTSRFSASDSIHSLEEIGITINDKGKLSLDKSKFTEKYRQDPAAVEQFFTADTTGVADRFDQLTEQLAGLGNSVLLGRVNSLNRTIQGNQSRINDMTDSLTRQRERLLNQFYQLETIISNMQSNLSAISQISSISSLSTSTSGN